MSQTLKLTIVLLISLFLSSNLLALNGVVEIDDVISKREQFIKGKIDKIDYLKQLWESEKEPNRKYSIAYKIIEEYSNFQADSAFKYIDKNRELAQFNKNQNQLLQNDFQYIFVLAQSGLLNEAESVLKRIEPKVLDPNQKIAYYKLSQRVYMNLKEFSQKTHIEKKYDAQQKKYLDSILIVVAKDSEDFLLYSAMKYMGENEFPLAKDYLKNYIHVIDTLSNDAARAYYYLSIISEGKEKKNYLLQSVEADIKSAVMQNRSLRILAELLYKEGDVKRAYKYLQISLNDANFYNTRLRNMQVAEVLPIVKKDYELERDQQHKRLIIGLFIIILLFLLVLVSAIYLRRKMKQLAEARKNLMEMNEHLTLINEEMNQTNEKLTKLSQKLKESDQVKEKYIGQILKLCSSYIQNISNLKKMINRKIKAGQIDDAYNMTLASTQTTSEFKEFYAEFDKAFLNIFPHFVEEFNCLLQEDKRFKLKQKDALNIELRIFALIRLGVKDSSQIAEFMNYTPVTIYSYRTKVKSRAINRDTFDNDILKVGA